MSNPTKKWSVFIFLAGDNDLDAAAVNDLREMKQIGSTDSVNVVVQMDREKRGAGRYFVTKEGLIKDDLILDLGETNTGDPKVLAEFLDWAISSIQPSIT